MHNAIDITGLKKINIIAIKRDNEVNVAFTAGYVMKKDDIIVILGDNKSLEKVQAIS